MKFRLLSLVVALIPLPATAAVCTMGTTSVTFVLPHAARNLRDGWHIKVAVGGGPPHDVQIDTGSVGIVVPRGVIGANARATNQSGQITYSSSGRILRGAYYLAQVDLIAPGSRGTALARTIPMRVLAIDRIDCTPTARNCRPETIGPSSREGMLGIGFGRGGSQTDTGTLSDAPTNAFLSLAMPPNGVLHPGYIIAADRVTLGLTDAATAGFSFVPLQRIPERRGDWATPPGCFALPQFSAGSICGTMLVDTGIAYAILEAPPAQRPQPVSDVLAAGTDLVVTSPNPQVPVLRYAFRTGDTAAGAAPQARWAAYSGRPFINTGRGLLMSNDYLFDAECGRIGFRPRAASTAVLP